jgi:hypothetical protein
MRTPRELFRNQRWHAQRRGIEFLFTFEEWLAWWETNLGPNWQQMRGKTRGKYVMARRGDRGPYRPDNVKCILAQANTKETVENGTSPRGEKHGHAVVDEKTAAEIFSAPGRDIEVADRFGVSRHLVTLIRTGRSWTHLTGGVKGFRADKGFKGEEHHAAKLTDEAVIDIFTSPARPSHLAATYGISLSTVGDIRKRRTWRHITGELS